MKERGGGHTMVSPLPDIELQPEPTEGLRGLKEGRAGVGGEVELHPLGQGTQGGGLQRMKALYNLEEGRVGCRCILRRWKFCQHIKGQADGARLNANLLQSHTLKEVNLQKEGLSKAVIVSSENNPSQISGAGTGNSNTPTVPVQKLGGVGNPSPAAKPMSLSSHPPVINPIVQKGEGRLIQPKLAFNPVSNSLMSIKPSSDLETNQVVCKRKRGPRPKDVIKTVQMNLDPYLSNERKYVKAGRPSKSVSS